MIFDDNCPMYPEREFGAPDHVPQVLVGFCMVPAEDKNKTKAQGYPVFREREYVKIIVPGDKQSEYFQPSTDVDRNRFPISYQKFKARESGPISEGMPIEQWPQLKRAEAMTLKAAGIHSVEALAAIHDGNIGKIGNMGRDWRAKAQAFLAVAKETAASQDLAAKNQKLMDQIAAMQAQIDELARAAEKRGPRQPRKEPEAA